MKASGIRLLIVDDHQDYRDAASAWFSLHDDLEVVGDTDSVADALDFLGTSEVDLVLLDVHLRDSNGIDGALLLFERHPRLRIVLCSTSDRRALPRLATFDQDLRLTFVSKPDLDVDAIVQWFQGCPV